MPHFWRLSDNSVHSNVRETKSFTINIAFLLCPKYPHDIGVTNRDAPWLQDFKYQFLFSTMLLGVFNLLCPHNHNMVLPLFIVLWEDAYPF